MFKSLGNDEGGQNPLRVFLGLLSGAVIIIVIVAFLTMPLDVIWGVAENESAPNAPDIWDNLDMVWLAIPIIFVIFIVLWAIAKIHSREVEAEVFLR